MAQGVGNVKDSRFLTISRRSGDRLRLSLHFSNARDARAGVVGEFHDVKEETGIVVSTDVEDRQEARVGAGDRFVLLDAAIFAVEGFLLFARVFPDDLYRVDGTGDPAAG
jgi:hypothetical protein